MIKNARKNVRNLEIGPGRRRIPNFETMDVVNKGNVDYVCDASKRMLFEDNTFAIVYASHVLEHIPWFQTEKVLAEWIRILKPGGKLEVWVPNGLKICEGIIAAENENKNFSYKDGWYRLNPEKNPYVWANGRIYTYGDGTGNVNHPNWHRALFTPKYLKYLFEKNGLSDIKILSQKDVRGTDHGWINLGIRGIKK